MLIDQIKKANMQALRDKNSNARAIYSVMINKYLLQEIALREKEEAMSDLDTISILQKTLKELADEKENFTKVNNLQRVTLLIKQEEYLNLFLPKMLSDEEITKEINLLEDKSIPNVMKHFKTNFAGKVEMRKVSQIVKDL